MEGTGRHAVAAADAFALVPGDRAVLGFFDGAHEAHGSAGRVLAVLTHAAHVGLRAFVRIFAESQGGEVLSVEFRVFYFGKFMDLLAGVAACTAAYTFGQINENGV